MSHGHEIIKCSCGKIIAQCRCMSKDKTVTIIEKGCEDCKNLTKPKEQELEQQVLTTLNLLVMELKTGGNWMEMHQPCADRVMEDVNKAISEAYTQGKEDGIKEVLSILDTAELKRWFDMPDTTENWKTWKRIRNSISDKMKGNIDN